MKIIILTDGPQTLYGTQATVKLILGWFSKISDLLFNRTMQYVDNDVHVAKNIHVHVSVCTLFHAHTLYMHIHCTCTLPSFTVSDIYIVYM